MDTKKYYVIYSAESRQNFKDGFNKFDGSITITERNEISNFLYYGEFIREVYIPDDPNFRMRHDYYSSGKIVNMIIAGPELRLFDVNTIKELGLPVDDIMEVVLSTDNLDIIKPIYERYKPKIDTSNLCYDSDHPRKNLHIFDWLLNEGIDIKIETSFINDVIDFNRIDVLDWLVANNISIPFGENIQKIIIESNSLAFMDWFYNNGFSFNKFTVTKYICSCVPRINKLNWLISKGIELIYDSDDFYLSLLEHDYELFKWFHEHDYPILWNRNLDNIIGSMNIEFVKWLIDIGINIKLNLQTVLSAVGRANLEMLDFLYENMTPFVYNEHTIDFACAKSDTKVILKILNWFYDHGLEIIYKNAIDNCCIHNTNTLVLDWFYQKGFEIRYTYGINYALRVEKTDLLDWLWDHQIEIKYTERDLLIAISMEPQLIEWFYNHDIKIKDFHLIFVYCTNCYSLSLDKIKYLWKFCRDRLNENPAEYFVIDEVFFDKLLNDYPSGHQHLEWFQKKSIQIKLSQGCIDEILNGENITDNKIWLQNHLGLINFV
jgi:hypothetical protein